MSDYKNYAKKEIQEITDNMIKAISLSGHFMHRLQMAEMIEEARMLKSQTDCCFRVLASVANLRELSAYDEEISTQLFDLGDYMRDIVDSCRIKTRNHFAKIQYECDGIHMVECNKDRLCACVMNLIVNSLQEIDPDEGVIKIIVKKMGDEVAIRVSDNGYGMADADIPALMAEDATGGFAVLDRFCKSVGTTPLIETGENSGLSVTIRLPISKSIDFHASVSSEAFGLFHPVNVYLAKIDRFDVTSLYR